MNGISKKLIFFINLHTLTYCKVKDDKNKLEDSVLLGSSLQIKNFGNGVDNLELELKKNVQYRIGNNITIFCESLKNSTNNNGDKIIIFSKNCKIKDNKDNFEIVAKNFEYNIIRNELAIKGNVLCTSKDVTLKTEQCHYDVNKNILFLDKKAEITIPKSKVSEYNRTKVFNSAKGEFDNIDVKL